MDIGAYVMITITFVFVINVLAQTLAMQKRLKQLSQVDAKLDALLQQAGTKFDPFEFVSAEVANALKSGDKIEAIKYYRKTSGASLKEAKEFVEELQRRADL